jgi:hypothetical protein
MAMSDTNKQASSGISFVEIYFFMRLLFRAVLLGLVLIALSEWYLSSTQKPKPAWLGAIEGAYYDGAYLAMKVAGWAFGTSQSQTTVRNPNCAVEIEDTDVGGNFLPSTKQSIDVSDLHDASRQTNTWQEVQTPNGGLFWAKISDLASKRALPECKT